MNPIIRRWCYAFLCAAVFAFSGCAQEETTTLENSNPSSGSSCPNCCDAPSRDAVSASQGTEDDCCKEVTPSQPSTAPANPPVSAQQGEGVKAGNPVP